jgi:site-specific DNA-methyltransferase (adenine-specific)
VIDLHLGDCLDVMRGLADASVDAVVTDPPAGIAFMGKTWDNPDHFPLSKREVSKKKGPWRGPAITYDGVDKSREGRTAFIDFLTPRMAEALRIAKPGTFALVWALPRTSHWTATAIEDAGWVIRDRISHLFGTGFPKAKSCLKPGGEDWWLAYKPGGKMAPLQIDACRIGNSPPSVPQPKFNSPTGSIYGMATGVGRNGTMSQSTLGRWPANVVLSEDAAADLDAMSGMRKAGWAGGSDKPGCFQQGVAQSWPHQGYGDTGGASRFFYTAKASRQDRGEGNTHPTVKSESLMRWLCRLITPPGGIILDPFAGSGSTGKAAILEDFGFVGIERDPGYHAIARKRLDEVQGLTPLLAEIAS